MSMAALCISAWRGTEWSEALEAVMCLSVTNHKPHTDESELQPANTHISTSSPSNTPPELFILWPCGNFYLQVITQSETRPLIKGQHFLFDINHEKGKKKKKTWGHFLSVCDTHSNDCSNDIHGGWSKKIKKQCFVCSFLNGFFVFLIARVYSCQTFIIVLANKKKKIVSVGLVTGFCENKAVEERTQTSCCTSEGVAVCVSMRVCACVCVCVTCLN